MAVPPPPPASLSSSCLSSLFLWSINFATMGTQWRLTSPTPGTRGCLACDEELRRPQADTSSAEDTSARRIQKSQHLSRGSLFKTWPTPETAHEKRLAPWVQCSPLYWYKTHQQANDLDRKELFFLIAVAYFKSYIHYIWRFHRPIPCGLPPLLNL